MTTSVSAVLQEDLAAPGEPRRLPPDTANLRAYGLALLPLALAGLLPLWEVALLCGVYALGVRSAGWAQGRLLLGVLVVSVGALLAAPGILNGGQAAAIAFASMTLGQLVATVALHVGAGAIEGGRRSGLLVPLVLGLVAPQALLLPALAGGALARPAEDDRPAAWQVAPDAPAWRWPLAALVAVTVLAALLPRGPSVWAALTRPPAPVTAAGPTSQPPLRQTAPVPARPRVAAEPMPVTPPLQLTLNAPLLPLELVLAAAVALGVALLWRARPGAGGPPATLVERLMALGLVLGGGVGLGAAALLTISSGSGGGADQSEGGGGLGGLLARSLGEGGPGRTIDLSALVNTVVILSVLLLAGLTVAAFLARRGEGEEAAVAGVVAPIGGPDEESPEPPPLHRVRRAWRAAEAALDASGRPRAPAESPEVYAARLGRDSPLLAGPLKALSRAYAPIRYGAEVSEAGAGAAERALTELRVLLPTLPPPRGADPYRADTSSADPFRATPRGTP